MKDFQISRANFSHFFWDTVGSGSLITRDIEETLEDLRKEADYNTGSLSDEDVYDLTAIVRYFKPTSVAEVGTFIGRSTHAIAQSMDSGQIWTCDFSNDLKLPPPTNGAVSIRQFPKTGSTDMLAKAIAEKQHFDLFYIDGRLTERDAELMDECQDPKGSVIVLDDFEGVEKGVANASMLLNTMAGGCTLVYPRARGKTAVLLPFSRVRFVPQV